MKYTNDKIKKLTQERDAIVEKYNRKIQFEIDIEKGKYKFAWGRFLLMISMVVWVLVAVEVNKKIFPKTSIWSWEYFTK